tara:strand:- start:12315 stop:13745 length:1431 start_codon:yes stop_codon:yes gene_type:complete
MESTDDAHSVAAATTGARDFDEIADGDDQAQDSKRRRMEDDDAEDLEQAERSVQRLHVSARDPLVSVYKEHDSTVLVTIDSHSSVETDLSKVTHDIILALDNSGSMAIDKKIQMLNKLTMDILRLGLPGVDKANTRIGIVAFGTTAQVVLDLTCLGDVEGRTHTPYFEQLKADGGGTNIQGALELATVEHSNTKDSHNLRKHVVLITDGAPSHGHRDGRALRKHLLAPMKDPKNQQVFYHIIGLGPDVSKQFCDKFCDEGRAALFSFAEETSNLSNVFEEVCALMRFIAGPLILEFNDADPEAPWRARAGMHMHNGKVWQKEYIMNHHNLLIDRTVGPRMSVRLVGPGFDHDYEDGFNLTYTNKPIIPNWDHEDTFKIRDAVYNDYIRERSLVVGHRRAVEKVKTWREKADVSQKIYDESVVQMSGYKFGSGSSVHLRRLSAENAFYQAHKNDITYLNDRSSELVSSRAATCSQYA